MVYSIQLYIYHWPIRFLTGNPFHAILPYGRRSSLESVCLQGCNCLSSSPGPFWSTNQVPQNSLPSCDYLLDGLLPVLSTTVT